jgi:hypothetical protein
MSGPRGKLPRKRIIDNPGPGSSGSAVLTSTQIGFGSSSNRLTGSSSLIYNDTNKQITLNGNSATTTQFNADNSSAVGSSAILLTQGGTFGGMIRYNSAFAGNFTGTSIAKANMLTFDSSTGSSATGPIAFNAERVVTIIGSTASNYGFKVDAIGGRFDTINNLHSSNLVSFAVGTTFTFDATNTVLKTGSQASKGATFKAQFLPYASAEPVVFGDAASSYTGMWMATTTPDSANYIMRYNGTSLQVNASSNVTIKVSNTTIMDINTSYIDFVPPGSQSGAITTFNFTTGASIGQTATAETIGFLVNMANTITHATGSIEYQRDFKIIARTHAFVGASAISVAATFYISGAPIAGTNATLLNKYALYVEAGNIFFGGLPISSTGLANGTLWNDLGTIKIV